MLCNLLPPGVNSFWSVLVFDCIFSRKSFPNSYMDMGYSNSGVNFSDVCTKSYTVRTCLAFCLLVEYFCYYITCRQENESPKIEPPKPCFAMISNERPFKLFIIWLFLEKKNIFSHLTNYDVITFCIWRVSNFPCILKPLCFIKNWSIYKRQPNV